MADLFTRGPTANDLFGTVTWEGAAGVPLTFQNGDNLFIDLNDLGGTSALNVTAPAILGDITLTAGNFLTIQGSRTDLSGDFMVLGTGGSLRFASEIGFNDPSGNSGFTVGAGLTVEVRNNVVERGTFFVLGDLVFLGPPAIPPQVSAEVEVRLAASNATVEINTYELNGTITVAENVVGTEIEVLSLGVLNGANDVAIQSLGGAVDIALIGSVTGDILLAGGDDTLLLRTAFTGDIDMGDGNNELDMFEFTAGSTTGNVTFGDGNDTFDVRGVLPGDVDMGGGDDTVILNNADIQGDFTLGAGNDTLTMSSSVVNVTVDAGSGNDVITTSIGADVIIGGEGNDTINTGNGNDTITAGSGTNTVTGGGGSDVFVFNAVGEVTTITDFDGAFDVLRLAGFVEGADVVRFFGTASNGKTDVDYFTAPVRGTADRQVIDITMTDTGTDVELRISNSADAFVLGDGDPDPDITLVFNNTEMDDLTLALFEFI